MDIRKDNKLKKELSFDLYGRYKAISTIILKNHDLSSRRNVLDVGGGSNYLERFLDNYRVTISDTDTVNISNKNINASGTDLPFSDNEFDWCVSADVLEHIHALDREKFIGELLRVSKLGVIITAPFRNENVIEAESRAHENYKSIHNGEEYRWLKEHQEIGLPDLEDTKRIIEKCGFSVDITPHNNIYYWNLLIPLNILFYSQKQNELVQDINHFYNNQFYPYDFIEPAYRQILFIKKSEVQSVHFPKKNVPTNNIINLNYKIVDILHKLLKFNQVDKVHRENDNIQQIIHSLSETNKKYISENIQALDRTISKLSNKLLYEKDLLNLQNEENFQKRIREKDEIIKTKSNEIERHEYQKETEINSLKEDHQNKIEQLKAQKETEINSLKEDHQNKIEQLKAQKETEINSLKEDHQNKIEQLKAQKETEINQIIEDKRKEIERIQKDYSNQRNNIQTQKNNVINKLIQNLDDSRKSIVDIISQINNARRTKAWKIMVLLHRMYWDLFKKFNPDFFKWLFLRLFTKKRPQFLDLSNYEPIKISSILKQDSLISKIDYNVGRKPELRNEKHEIQKIKFDDAEDVFVPYKKNPPIDPVVKAIAFYLPQFHPIPENDKNWGKGFTEWTNVTKAKPNFEGHYQPHLPIHLGFYDLRLPEVLKEQAALARNYGIHGFCMYYYWFNGRRPMMKPLDNFLNNKDIDINLCLCWANENWTRKWDGLDNEIIFKQNYSFEDTKNFTLSLLPFFKDERYIKIDEKPMLLIYNPIAISKLKAHIKIIRAIVKENGFNDIYLIGCRSLTNKNKNFYKEGFDADVEFPPHGFSSREAKMHINPTNPNFNGRIIDYSTFYEIYKNSTSIDYEKAQELTKIYKTALLSWDNTARNPDNASVFHEFDIDVYKNWLNYIAQLSLTDSKLKKNENFIFINAWNEWAEGNHLEPDRKFGYAYLQSTYDVLKKIIGKNNPLVSVIVPNYNHSKYLRQRLDSVYNQTYENIEVILLDDGSTDESQKILIKYVNRFSEISKLIINKKNSGGVFHQWAKGIEHATGDLIWIAESDDFSDLDFLEKLVEEFKDESVMLAYSNCVFVDEKGNELKHYSFQDYVKDIDESKWLSSYSETAHIEVNSALGLKNTIPNVSGVLFRKPLDLKLLKDKNWLSMKVAGDWMFYLHIISGGKITFNKNTNNYFRRYKGSAAESTYKKKVYYEEVGRVCSEIALLYRVSESLLNSNRRIFWNFYQSQIGDNELQFNEWFNFDQVKKSAQKRMPTILIIIFAFYPGGAEILPIRLANELKRKGYPVLMQACEPSYHNQGVRKLLRNDIPVVKECSAKNYINHVVKPYGIDIVNSHHWHFQRMFVNNGNILGNTCRHIATLHGIIEADLETDNGGYNIKKKDILEVDKCTDYWIPTTDKNINPFFRVGINANDNNRFIKISNGVEVNEYETINRSDIGIPEDAFVVCSVSRAIKEKGWLEAINAVKISRENAKKDIRLILVGNGPIYDELKSNGIPDYVHMPGLCFNSTGYYAASDLGLLLSTFQSESFPMTILDCLRAEKPCIASNIGEIKQMLSDGEEIAGHVFDLNNWSIPLDHIASVISEFAQKESKYNNAKSIATRIKDRYSINNTAEKYIKVYKKALSKK